MTMIIGGGKSRRMKKYLGIEDKFNLPFAGTSLLSFIVKRLFLQIDIILLNAQGRVEGLNIETLKDVRQKDEGPLGGIVTALTAAKERGFSHVITLACDTPFFPDDYVEKLKTHSSAPLVICRSKERLHPLMGIWDISLLDDLNLYLDQGGRKMLDFIGSQHHVVMDCKDELFDPFFNINYAQDLEEAEKIAENYFS